MEHAISHSHSLPAAPLFGCQLPAADRTYDTPRDVIADTGLSRAKKREILAFWASDACAVESRPGLRTLPGANRPVRFDEIMRALRTLDGLDPDDPPFGGGASAWPKVRRRSSWRDAGPEPTIDEVLADPIVRQLMSSDGVTERDIRQVVLRAA